MVVAATSLAISVLNIVVDFPAQIFDIAEKEEEWLMLSLQAEAATNQWEDKLRTQLVKDVERMLKVSTTFEANKVKGFEAPRLVIDDVMTLERKVMHKRLGYIEYFMQKSVAERDRLEKKRRKAKRDQQTREETGGDRG